MHRSYQPYTPVNNLLLKQKWDKETFNIHRKKVAAAEAVINNNPPTVYMHLHLKLKKLQEEANRLAIIERDNKLLLDKMEHIMVAGGSVEHVNKYTSKSLNRAKRQRELLRVSHENMAILKRIATKEPYYDHQQWQVDWQVNEQYRLNISKYPTKPRFLPKIEPTAKPEKKVIEFSIPY